MSERSGTLSGDPLGGRRPTSHERLTGLPWDASYRDGPAPWDVGRPQPAVVRLASAGGFVGAVLDVGCGTGENALHLASMGLPVLGVDVAETALATARAKADERGIEVAFAAADAFRLDGTLYVLCFADEGPGTGPHPVSQQALRAAFSPGTGWEVAAIRPDRLETRFHDDGAPAWLATIKRF
jgi:SAM-dependent methyltransferase